MNAIEIIYVFILPFALTVAAEGFVMFLMFRRKDFVYYSFLCNLLTNPALNLFLLICNYFMNRWFLFFLIGEFIVWLVEAKVYGLLCGFKAKKALALSLALNGITVLLTAAMQFYLQYSDVYFV